MQSIKERFGIEEDVPKRLKANEWQKELLIWLGMASTRGRMVLFIDGVDQVIICISHGPDDCLQLMAFALGGVDDMSACIFRSLDGMAQVHVCSSWLAFGGVDEAMIYISVCFFEGMVLIIVCT